MQTEQLDTIRAGVLAQMERTDRWVRLGILGAAALEAALIAILLLTVDFKNPTARLILLSSFVGYSMLALGLLALAAHVTRVVRRVVTLLAPGRTIA